MDKLTLKAYEEDKGVNWDNIKRRLLLNERSVNAHIPDHFLHAAIDHYIDHEKEKIDSLDKLLTRGLAKLATEYIIDNAPKEKDHKLYIKKEQFSLWQEQLTFCPPLLLIATKKKKKYSDGGNDKEFIANFIMPNVKHTALLPLYIENFSNKGFHDLHIHLNGSTEADVI
jgi:hypothetical protein